MTDSNLMMKKEENTVPDGPPTPVLRRDELITGKSKSDVINNFYLNDEEDAYVKEPSISEQAFRQAGGLGLEIGAGITTDQLTAPLLVTPVPGARIAYGVINFASGYASNVAAQKIRGDEFSYGEAIANGIFQMLPFGSTGKGLKGLAGAGLQGGVTAGGETTVRTAIDEQRLPTAGEFNTAATIGIAFGTGFKGSIDFLGSLSKKFQGKSAAEIDSLITNEDKSRLEELLKNADSDEAKKIARGIREGDIGFTDADGLIDEIVDGATYEQLINPKLKPFQDLETGGIGKKRRGAEYLKKRILKQFPVKGADPIEAEETVKFIDKFADRLDDVSISVTNKIGAQGRYNFATNLIQIRQKTIDEGELTETMIHELWHSLSRYLPKKDLDKLNKDFLIEKNEYLRGLNVRMKVKDAEDARLAAVEFAMFGKGKYTTWNYRFKDVDEFFAENLKDISLERLDDDLELAPSGTWKRITQEVSLFIRDLFVSLKAKLGGPQSQRIYNDFLKNKNVVKQRKGPLDSPEFDEVIEGSIDSMAGDIRQAKTEFETQQKGNDFEGPTKELPDLPDKKKRKKSPLEGTDTTPHQINPDQVTNAANTEEIKHQQRQFNFIVKRIKQLKDEGAFSQVKTTADTIDGGIKMLADTNELKEHAQMYAKIYGLVPTDELNYALAEAVTISTNKATEVNQKLIDAVNVSKDPALIEQNINELVESIGEIDEWLRLGVPLRTEQGRGFRSMQIKTQGVTPEAYAKMTPAEKYKLRNLEKSSIGISSADQGLPLEELKAKLLKAAEKGQETGDYTSLNKLTNTIKRADGNVEKLSALYETGLLNRIIDSGLSKGGKFVRIFNEIGINALLAAPTTNEINFASGVLETYMSSYELIRGAGSRTELDAAIRHFHSLHSNGAFVRKAFTESFKTSDNFINRGAVKADYQEKFVISSEGKDIISRAIDTGGKVIRFPSQLMTATDAMVQAPNLIAHAHYQGHIEGVKAGKKGAELDQYIKEHVDAILEYYASNSGKGIKDSVTAKILKRSQEFAKRSTFTENIREDDYALMPFGQMAAGLNQQANKIPLVRAFMAFVRAPTNIIKRQLRRTPALNLLLKELRNDLQSNDPGVRSQARGQMKVAKEAGIVITGLVGAGILAQQDPNFVPPVILTGGGPDWKNKEGRAVFKSMIKNGWQPYSVGYLEKDEAGQPVIGEDGKPVYKYYSYERLDPLSSWIGLMADFVAVNGVLTDDEYDEFTVGWTGAFARNITDRSYLAQLDQTFKALSGVEEAKENFVGQFLASRFFYGNFNRYAKQLPGDLLDMAGVSKDDSARFHQKRDTKVRAGDYWDEETSKKDEGLRALRKILNKYTETIPGYTRDLPFLHEHITNEPILYPQRPGPDLVSWMKTSTSKNHPLWTALGQIGKELREPSDTFTGIGTNDQLEAFRLDTNQYAELRRIINGEGENGIKAPDNHPDYPNATIDQAMKIYLKSNHYKTNSAIVKKRGALTGDSEIAVNEIYSKLKAINTEFIEAGQIEWIKTQTEDKIQSQFNKKRKIQEQYLEDIKSLSPN